MTPVMSSHRFLAVSVALMVTIVWSISTRTQIDQPAATAGRFQPEKAPRLNTFVGADACVSCHAQTHDAWKGARHSKMLQPATSASVKGDFTAARLALRGRAYGLRVKDGEYFVTESFLTGKPREHRVEYTLGSRRIQHYLTTIENGWIVVLPPSWDVERQQWFDNVEIIRPDEDEHKIVQQWNKNCVGCHVSEQDNNYNPATHTYATTWTDFGTSCERCHGAGGIHVQQYRRGGDARPPDRAIVRPTRLDPARSSMICAQCHSLRDVIAPGYSAGADYYDHFQPLLEYRPRKTSDPAYWADGRPRRFSNDAIGLWQSECFLRGGATCTSCHRDPHVPDVDRNAQLAPSNNALCTGCHAEVAASLAAHTRHRTGSAGTSCVECHMPKTVTSIKAKMRDHTIGIPVPENTVAFGIPNACTECHADRKADWAVDMLNRWWPQGRRLKWIDRARTFTAARAGRPEALDRLLAIAEDPAQGPLVRANALGYLGGYQDPRAVAALVAAAKADHAAVRASAVSSLGLMAQSDAPQATVLSALDDPRRAVRITALMSLINRGITPLSPADLPRFRSVAREFAARARPYEDDARIQRDLGLVQLLAGEVDRGADALQISVGLEPDRPTSRFLLAMARLGQRRVDEARELLKQVAPSDPYFKAAQESLKQIRR
jgi:predicted CXXCH cytochrome family protein